MPGLSDRQLLRKIVGSDELARAVIGAGFKRPGVRVLDRAEIVAQWLDGVPVAVISDRAHRDRSSVLRQVHAHFGGARSQAFQEARQARRRRSAALKGG